jgi:perosamine synthetase
VPVFVDIDSSTFNIDPRLVESAITKRTKAILCVHQMGMPCDLSEIVRIARQHKLPVVEDAACAIGSEINWHGAWEKIGKPHGDVACFSLHPRKLLTTGDGGVITTSSAIIDKFVRVSRNHGLTSEAGVAPVSVASSPVYATLGYNYRMTDVQAAIGREQLKRLDDLIARRRAHAEAYGRLLANIKGIEIPEEPAWCKNNWQSFCVGLPDGCDQSRVVELMHERGIATKSGIMCAHREPAYTRGDWRCAACQPGVVEACSHLSSSEHAQDRSLILPICHEMDEQQIEYVVESLRESCRMAMHVPHLNLAQLADAR